MSSDVQKLLERIMQLPEAQQRELRAELARRDEKEWIRFSNQARDVARQEGIDDDAITRAVESLRYGDDAKQ